MNRSYEKHQQKLMEIRSAASKKKKIAPTGAPIMMDDELIDTVHNIRIKSNEFREFGKEQVNKGVIEKCNAIQKQNQKMLDKLVAISHGKQVRYYFQLTHTAFSLSTEKTWSWALGPTAAITSRRS